MIKVLQNKDFINTTFTEELVAANLQEVAVVDTNELEEAFILTQNIDSSWTFLPQIKTDLKECRSTSAGDVLIKDEEYFLICLTGFKKIDIKDYTG